MSARYLVLAVAFAVMALCGCQQHARYGLSDDYSGESYSIDGKNQAAKADGEYARRADSDTEMDADSDSDTDADTDTGADTDT